MPSRKAPCACIRRLSIPALDDERLISGLTAAQLEASYLPPLVLECERGPLLWGVQEWPALTVRDVAKRLLTAMFKLSHGRIAAVGKETVLQLRVWELMQGRWDQPVADIACWLQRAQQHRASCSTPSSGSDEAMWALAEEANVCLQQAEQEHAALTPQQQHEARAVALFQNPPVVDKGPGHTEDRFFTCCWPIKCKKSRPRCVACKQSTRLLVLLQLQSSNASFHSSSWLSIESYRILASRSAIDLWSGCSNWQLVCIVSLSRAHFCCRTLCFQRGYPALVLQEASPRVTIKMKDLVIHMTQGPKPANQSLVLHFDETVKFLARSKLQWQQLTGWELTLFNQQLNNQPKQAACQCRSCISSGCLFYGTQSENALTGSHHEHQHKKKKKGWHYRCSAPLRCPMCKNYRLYIAKKKAREEAKKKREAEAAATQKKQKGHCDE